MTDLRVTLTDNGFEFEEIEQAIPEPGERCPTCDRRVPKPRKVSSPASKRIVATLPAERAEAVDDALEALQAYVGADKTSYPRGAILELLVVLGGQHREELKAWFNHEPYHSGIHKHQWSLPTDAGVFRCMTCGIEATSLEEA